jgi:purine nucleoside phosphorylase
MGELTIGVIGGSGLYDLEGLDGRGARAVETPFGAPSDAFMVGRLGGRRMVFLPRHGVGHRILPHRDQLPREHLGHEEARRRSCSRCPRWAP